MQINMNVKNKKIKLIGVAALFLINSVLFSNAEPKLDASSGESASNSLDEMLIFVQESPDIGIAEKSHWPRVRNMVDTYALQYVFQKVGENPTPNQINKYAGEFYKKYDGMTAMEFYTNVLLEIKNQKEAEANLKQAKAEAAEKEKAQKEEDLNIQLNKSISDWLQGIPQKNTQFPDKKEISVNFNEENRCLEVNLNVPSQFDVRTINYILLGQFSKDYNYFGENGIEVNSTIFPLTKNFKQSSNDDNLILSENSANEIFWFAPKFKEWTNKILSLPENDRPHQVFKEIPYSSLNSEERSSENDSLPPLLRSQEKRKSIYYLFDKKLGPSICVIEIFPEDNKEKIVDFVKSGEQVGIDWNNTQGFSISIPQLNITGGKIFTIQDLIVAESSWNNFLDKKNEIAAQHGGESKNLNIQKESQKKVLDKLQLD